MPIIEFESARQNSRGVGLVGDALYRAIGKPIEPWTYLPLRINVTRQPSGSDVFTGGSNVTYATASAATLAVSGFYAFTCDAGAGTPLMTFEVVAFPAAAANVPQIKYANALSPPKPDAAIRAILKSIANSASQAALQAKLEPASGYYLGTDAAGANLAIYGGGIF